MFVDSVDIFISSGNGGAGAVSFRREKFIIQGGPDGGDGGKGGDIIFEVDSNADTLSKFRGKKHYKAQNGAQGGSRNCTGKNGANLTIKIPLGTQIRDFDSGELIADLNAPDSTITILKGGKGGMGNARFKNATRQTPTYAQSGIKGESLHIKLELKLIADVGLVGFPNVGKSTLISTLSNAKPEIADYEFTTLIPNLGVVEVDELRSFVMADIPGIIEGASSGRGLGIQFLKHIERTKFLLFVLDTTRGNSANIGVCDNKASGENSDKNNSASGSTNNLVAQFETLRKELANFSAELFSRDFGIVLSKSDIAEQLNPRITRDIADLEAHLQTLNNPQKFLTPISSLQKMGLDELRFALFRAIHNE